MGNEPNVLTVDSEVQILGTRKGFYKPGRKISNGILLWKEMGCLEGTKGDEMFAHRGMI